MDYGTNSDWEDGPSDLKEADVEDVPTPGKAVRVRGLPAGYSNQAQSEATELKQVGDSQFVNINAARLEVLQFAHGCIKPTFTVEQATAISEKYGPAFKKIIAKIDELSAVDKAAVEAAEARFPGGRNGPVDAGQAGLHAASEGSGGPDLPVRVGPRAGDGS